MTLTTLELLDAWHAGDKEALVELIQRHAPWLRSHVRKRMTHKMRLFESSDDVVQSVLYNLLRYTPPFRPQDERQFRALIARAVYNRMIELHDYSTAGIRDPSRGEPMPSAPSRIGVGTPSSARPDSLSAEAEERGFVALALQLVEPEEARLIQLHDFEGLPFQEIGERLGNIGEEASRSRYRRALERLRIQVLRLRKGQTEELLRELEGHGD